MKVGIIGYGTEGRVSYDYWKARGNHVAILDANSKTVVPDGASAILGESYLDNLDHYDLLVRSPGTKPWLIQTTAPVTSMTREFFARCPAPIIGVTGTKGKSTTSTLIAEILKATGKTVWFGGNIGRPALEFLDRVREGHLVVLELSSFQLMDLEQSPQVAVCLMVVPDHLDWHRSFAEYVQAKSQIARYQRAADLMVYLPQNAASRQIGELSIGHKLPYTTPPGAFVDDGQIVVEGQIICRADEVGLIGPHNLDNICAAITATWDLVGKRVDLVAAVLKSFHGLPFRIEQVATIDGMTFINDSFSVNQYATIAALKSFAQEKVVILGGFDRGIDLTPLVDEVVEARPRQVVLVGQTGAVIGRMLKDRGYQRLVNGGGTMAEIVRVAREAARPGDVVLLSPGCPSFDMFKNFEDRGRQFNQAVKAVEK